MWSVAGCGKNLFRRRDSQTGSEVHPTSLKWVSEDSCSEIKQPERDADNSSPSSADIKNGRVASATGHLYALMAWWYNAKKIWPSALYFIKEIYSHRKRQYKQSTVTG
jgi:hypothetical protein